MRLSFGLDRGQLTDRKTIKVDSPRMCDAVFSHGDHDDAR